MCSSCYGPMARTEHSEHVEHVDLGQRKFMGGPANARIAVPQTATGTTTLKKTPVRFPGRQPVAGVKHMESRQVLGKIVVRF